jgi:hypothetical protein
MFDLSGVGVVPAGGRDESSVMKWLEIWKSI